MIPDAPVRRGLSPRSARRYRRRLAIAILVIAATALLVTVAARWVLMHDAVSDTGAGVVPAQLVSRPVTAVADAERAAAVADTSSTAAVERLAPDEAVAANARIPITAAVGPAARPLAVMTADPRHRDRASDYIHALDCMTAAIYYEAASEPIDGQRAVAQVVLNRVRHAAYPHTVCGVVYQGAERSTGCQFSFACDGSLQRLPMAAAWRRAMDVARAALAGYVFAPVGLATHYHADYVLPRWAPSLVKLAVIGRHIFYRWPSLWGQPPSFDAPYAGNEPDVAALLATRGPGPTDTDPAMAADTGNAATAPAMPADRPVLMPGAPTVADGAATPAARLPDAATPAVRAGVTGGVIMPSAAPTPAARAAPAATGAP